MGTVTIQRFTYKNPISMIGEEAGVCWGADTSDPEKNYKRGLDCLENEHGRTFEFPDVYMILDGYSARVIREWYTHIGGAPTRLQASTLIDLKSRTFGKLTVIQKDPEAEPGKAKWICECECGNIVSVLSDSLRSDKTKSCGCSQFQIKHDLTDQTFGFLKVIELVKNTRIRSNETRWKCLCQNCGRTVEVSSYWLRHSDPYGHCKCTRFNKPR